MAPRLAAAASALLCAAALVMIGCSKGPKPADGSGAASKPGQSYGTRVWQPAVPDTFGPVVAVVAGRKITRHEIDSLIATAPVGIQTQLRTPEGYHDVVSRIVLQEAMYDGAKRAGLEQDTLYQAQVRQSTRDLLIRRFYEWKISAQPEISDSAALAYYDAHQEEYAVSARARVRHIQFSTRAKAQERRRALVKGALWDATCLKYSTDKASRETGGLLGWVAKDSDLVPGVGKSPAIVAAAYSLPIDEISQPLKSEKNWHLIRVETREEKTVQPFETVKARILTKLRTDRREEYGKLFSDSLLQMSNATIFDDSIRVALSPAKTPEDFFKEAQAAVTPLQRIEAYRELIQRFPTDRVSIQAQFMIGFTYAEEMGEYEQARKEFEDFIRAHPDSDLAGSAKWMMDNMDRPAPELDEESPGKEGGAPAPPESGKSGTPGGSEYPS
jgi:peptidyl-prolyl cis-trans isomerase C